MTNDTFKKITHSGELQIGDMKVPCYVTSDGTRLMSSGKIAYLLESGSKQGVRPSSKKAPKIQQLLQSTTLKPFVDKLLDPAAPMNILSPVKAKHITRDGAVTINGYLPEAFTTICRVMITAKEADALSTRKQKHIARQCELIRDALAWGVGITALIDEATGYQYDRAKDALQTLFNHYLVAEFRPWVKTIPNAFYKEISRLTGLHYNPHTGKMNPAIGKIMAQFIYATFPEGIPEELERRNPIIGYTPKGRGMRAHKHHQWLTKNVGIEELNRRVQLCIAIMKGHDTWKSFIRHWAKVTSPDKLKLLG